MSSDKDLTPIPPVSVPPVASALAEATALSDVTTTGTALTNGLERDTLRSSNATAKRTRKSMSRRRGQNGHIEKSGRWFVVRFWKDVPGQEKRVLARAPICPISGTGSLSASARERRAKEIIRNGYAGTF